MTHVQDLPVHYRLDATEVEELEALLADLASHDPGDGGFYDRSWEVVPQLPSGLREFMHAFRTREPSAAAVISGLPVDDASMGPTPPNWQEAAHTSAGRREEIYLGLLAMTLGEPFTWSTLQRGRMIQNVIPIEGDEAEQSGHGQVLLEWHTEDAFHPSRADYLLLFGARNHDGVATTLASFRDVDLSEADLAILAEQRFHILPDDEHVRQLEILDPTSSALARMRRMRDEPEPVAVLFGAPDDPYLRVDTYFMRPLPGDHEAARALEALVTAFDTVQQRVVVDQGSVLVVDNYRAVHGREPFKARFDGTDRWLKKTVATRDLRGSRHLRTTPDARVIS